MFTCCGMLAQAAREAYRSFLLAYNSHQLKSIFNVHRLDLVAVAKSFGFSAPPKVCTARTAQCLTPKLQETSCGSWPGVALLHAGDRGFQFES